MQLARREMNHHLPPKVLAAAANHHLKGASFGQKVGAHWAPTGSAKSFIIIEQTGN